MLRLGTIYNHLLSLELVQIEFSMNGLVSLNSSV